MILIFTGGCLRKASKMETVKVIWEKWLTSFKEGDMKEKAKLIAVLILAIPVLIVIYPISLFLPKGDTNG